ncbi:MAG: efflux RND transporter periplasmic adaptor subunit [Bacteroidetes bacterium]|nr:efflux RND transporter periplasmic adaptor subunit [Bacteroidota bacterium]
MQIINPFKVAGMLILALLFIVSCQSGEPSDNTKTSTLADNKIQSVEVVKPQSISFSGDILITGTALAFQQVMLHSMENGYVKSIHKDIGDIVKAGEIIAELENPELTGQLAKLKAREKVAKSTYERLKSTYEKTPAISPVQVLENAEADYLTLKAELQSVSERVGFLKVRAPFSGVITRRFVDNGAIVQSGIANSNTLAIVEIQQVQKIRLTLPLPESDIANVKKGMETTVTFPELAGEAFVAKISRMSNALDPASKTMQVEIDIDNSKGLIKPGMYAKVLIQTSSRDGVLSLPITAQVSFQNQLFVLVAKDGKVERVPLRKGLAGKDYFEILNQEITENSLVIVQGKGLVKPGQEVNPVLKK